MNKLGFVLILCLVSLGACTYGSSKRVQDAIEKTTESDDASGLRLFKDEDGDGYGVEEDSIERPEDGGIPAGYAEKTGDCHDKRYDIHPTAFETVGDGEDQNCDGVLVSLPQTVTFETKDNHSSVSGSLSFSINLEAGSFELSGTYTETKQGQAPEAPKSLQALGTYDPDERKITMTATEGEGANKSEVFECTSDESGRLLSQIERKLNGEQVKSEKTITYQHDEESGHLANASESRVRSGEEAVSVKREWEYDNKDSLIRETIAMPDKEPSNHLYNRQYDDSGRLVSIEVGGSVSDYHYDASGRLESVTESLTQERKWTYDEKGNIATYEKKTNSEELKVTLSDYVDLPFEIYPLVRNDFVEELIP